MDPQACLERYASLLRAEDALLPAGHRAWSKARDELVAWLRGGGFEPRDWSCGGALNGPDTRERLLRAAGRR